MGQKLKIAGWISAGAVAGALTTVQLQAVARAGIAPLPLEELQQLAAVFGMVKSDYVEPVDEKKLITDAISGMVASLDPHSVYFDKKSFKEFREGTTGRFVGVGIEISQEDGLVKVGLPIEGSPADRAGLKPNDLITRIDDTAVKGLSLNEAVKRMRGEPKTKVLLTIFRKDENRTFPVTITREEIRTQSVRSKVVEPGYAWIRLSQFQERTVDDFVTKLEQIYKQEPNLKGLVLDLRNDPGGLLDAAVAVSSAFLPENVTVVSTNGQLAESKFTYKASPEFYQRRNGSRPAQAPAGRAQDRAAGGAGQRRLGLGQRNRGRRAAGPQARHHHGQPDLRQGLGANRAPAGPRHRPEAHHGALLHPERQIHPGARHRARRAWWTKPPKAARLPPCAPAKPTSRSTSTAARAPKSRTQPRKGPRRSPKRLEEEAKKTPEQRRPPELGSDKDFQLAQAINQLKGQPVLVSKTQVIVENKEEKKELTDPVAHGR
jgi:carboxyl-terminal processing protease